MAGLDRRGSTFEAEHYFLRCVKELSIIVPESKETVRAYACDTARQIIDGHPTPKDGVRDLFEIYMATGYDSDYKKWDELNEGLNSLLGES